MKQKIKMEKIVGTIGVIRKLPGTKTHRLVFTIDYVNKVEKQLAIMNCNKYVLAKKEHGFYVQKSK